MTEPAQPTVDPRPSRAAGPVFIVGEARSGTSILYRTLQKHGSFAPKRQNLVETEMFAHLPRTFLFGATYPDPWIQYFLGDQEEWQAFLRSITLPRLATAVLAPLNYGFRHRWQWLYQAGMGPTVLRSFLVHAQQARGCRRLVEKTPTNTPHLARLTALSPQARLLYVYRHPVDVYSSYCRRASVDATGTWARLDAKSFSERWTTSTQHVLGWIAAGHTNLLAIRYEDFVADSSRVFEQVCTFLDEPFEAQAVEEASPNPRRWPVDPHLWGAIVPKTKDWRDHIDAESANEVQRLTSGTMSALGYEPYPTRRAD